MPHLRKAENGHLLKNVRGHLITECADQDLCDLLVSASGGIEGYDHTFYPDIGGYFVVFTFQAYSIPDRLIIYIDGVIAADTGVVSGTHIVRVYIPFGVTSVRVVVIGSEEYTEWALSSYCETSSSSSSSSSSPSSSESSSSSSPIYRGFMDVTVVDCYTVPGHSYASGSTVFVTMPNSGPFTLGLLYSGSNLRVRLKEGFYGSAIIDYSCTTHVDERVNVVSPSAGTIFALQASLSTACEDHCPVSYYLGIGYV